MFALSTVFVHITHYCIFVGPDMTLEGTPGMVPRLFCGRCGFRAAYVTWFTGIPVAGVTSDGTPSTVLLHFRCRCRAEVANLAYFPGISGPGVTLEGTPGMDSRLFCGRCHARNAKRTKGRKEETKKRKSGMEKRLAPAGYFSVGPFQPRIPFCRL